MKKVVMLLGVSFLPFLAISQNNDSKFGISFSGFIKNDFFWDSRQNVSIREGHFLLYPSPVLKDAEEKDINAKSNFNFLSIQTRLTGKITGPDAFNAKTSGIIEADFFGNENANFIDVNGFRLRHAYAKLNWQKTELLFGQYWHPMFIAENFPGVVSFNTGSPFQPFSRNPQIRLTQNFGKISLVAVVNSQRDFVSPGGSSLTIRNSGIPEGNIQFIYNTKNDSLKTEFLTGIGVEYKTLAPRLYSEITTITAPSYYSVDTATWAVTYHSAVTVTKRYKSNETVSGYAAYAFMKYKAPSVTFKLYGTYGQNLFDLTMLGGYVVTGIKDKYRDLREYTSFNTMSVWTEMHTNGKKIQTGIFGGYTQNMGADKDIKSYSTTNRGADIKSIYRVAPRIIFYSEKFQFLTEVEYTTASYATLNTTGVINRDSKGVITETEDVSNTRFLFAVMYKF